MKVSQETISYGPKTQEMDLRVTWRKGPGFDTLARKGLFKKAALDESMEWWAYSCETLRRDCPGRRNNRCKAPGKSRETKETGGTAWECGSRVLIEEEEARAHCGDVEPRKEFAFDSKCDGKPMKPNDGF